MRAVQGIPVRSSAGQGGSHIQDPSLPQGETRLVWFGNQSYGETEPGRLEAGARLFCSRDLPGAPGRFRKRDDWNDNVDDGTRLETGASAASNEALSEKSVSYKHRRRKSAGGEGSD